MYVPIGYTEKQVLDAIEKAVRILAPKYVFGTVEEDDLKQEGRLEAILALNKKVKSEDGTLVPMYDPSRPLENFIYTVVNSRLLNYKRNKFTRSDTPCKPCHQGNPCSGNGSPCHKYTEWFERNRIKTNIHSPLGIDNVADEHESSTRMESSVESDAEIHEILCLIDTKLPADLRADYLRMRAQVNVPRARRQLVEAAVHEIIGTQEQ